MGPRASRMDVYSSQARLRPRPARIMSEAITLRIRKRSTPYYNRGTITYQAKGDNVRALGRFRCCKCKADPRFALAFNRRGLLQEKTSEIFRPRSPDFKAALTIEPRQISECHAGRRPRLEEKNAATTQPAPPATGADTRVALVIGNSSYANVQKISNPKADPEKISGNIAGGGLRAGDNHYQSHARKVRRRAQDFASDRRARGLGRGLLRRSRHRIRRQQLPGADRRQARIRSRYPVRGDRARPGAASQWKAREAAPRHPRCLPRQSRSPRP